MCQPTVPKGKAVSRWNASASERVFLPGRGRSPVVSVEMVMLGTEQGQGGEVVDQLWILSELGVRLASASSAEAAVELCAEAIGLALAASWQRPRGESGTDAPRDAQLAVERARSA